MLFNLLGNAVKFTRTTPERLGWVKLQVLPGTDAHGQACLQLSISDNGIGMSEEVMQRLFTPFTQASTGTARQFGGTGLGLSISQHLAQLMGGQIRVESQVDEGSVFTLELPLQQADHTAAPQDTRLTGLQLVTLTQDPMTSLTLHDYASFAGAEVTHATDLSQALQHVAQRHNSQRPVVLLLGLAYTTPVAALALPEGVGVVRLVRRLGQQQDDAVAVLTRPLLYHDLIDGVARAAGRLDGLLSAQVGVARHLPLPTAPSVEQAVADGQLILLAEDNETNRDVMSEQLRLLGYAVELAQDGVQALALWQTQRHALLLTDCHMPHMDGFELTRRIRQAEATTPGHRLPIIAVSANAMQGEAQHCKDQGMDDFLAKPLRIQELELMLAKWLPRLHHIDIAPDTVAVSAYATRAISLFDIWNPATLGELVGDNPAMHRRLLEKFLQQAQPQVQALCAGQTRTELVTIKELAHTLKSAARTVGALRLGEHCQQIEQSAQDRDTATCHALLNELAEVFEQSQTAITAHLNVLAT